MAALRRAALGAVAGIAGTAGMTAYQTLVGRVRSGGDEDEPRSDEEAWEEAPAPARVARLALEPLLGRGLPAERIPLLTNVVHWGYGTGWGVLYGLVRRRRGSAALPGLLFGSGVWASSYATLVPLGIYEPPWTYPATELALDLSYHLVYGLGVARAFERLAPAR